MRAVAYPSTSGAVFVISVVARLLAMHPATLRKYERAGFLEPARTSGNVRLYSQEDLARLRQIKYLIEERGMNLAGVEMALEMTRRLKAMARLLGDQRDGREGRREAGEMVRQALDLLGAREG